jgi:hypothetical protein
MRAQDSLLLRLAAAAALLGAPSLAGPVEVHGRPLRGLTMVRVADVVRDPAALAGRAFRIGGRLERAAEGGLAVRDGEASIALETIGFSLPGEAAGARVSAEGRLGKRDETRAVRFLADGVEVTR